MFVSHCFFCVTSNIKTERITVCCTSVGSSSLLGPIYSEEVVHKLHIRIQPDIQKQRQMEVLVAEKNIMVTNMYKLLQSKMKNILIIEREFPKTCII